MTFTHEGDPAEIYDYVPAYTVDEGDQIAYSNDLIEVKTKVDEGDTVMLRGYSHVSGDTVTYFIGADTEVGLWTA